MLFIALIFTVEMLSSSNKCPHYSIYAVATELFTMDLLDLRLEIQLLCKIKNLNTTEEIQTCLMYDNISILCWFRIYKNKIIECRLIWVWRSGGMMLK